MPFDLIRRIRWGNVAFAAAVVVVLAHTLTPAFASTPLPRLPSDRAAPLISNATAVVALATESPTPTKRETKKIRSRPRKPRRAHRDMPAPRPVARRAPAPRAAPAPPPKRVEPKAATSTVTQPIAPPRAPAPSASTPSRGEFGFEGG